MIGLKVNSISLGEVASTTYYLSVSTDLVSGSWHDYLVAEPSDTSDVVSVRQRHPSQYAPGMLEHREEPRPREIFQEGAFQKETLNGRRRAFSCAQRAAVFQATPIPVSEPLRDGVSG